MLHISPEEQKARLLARLDDPTKHWKYHPSDVDERAQWPRYRAAYEIALERTNTEHAPWFVIPSGRKWYRNLAIGRLLYDTLRGMDPQGVKITSYKAPTKEELAHDFLWRIRNGVPGPGVIGVFDRSHYEDVLIARVRELAPAE